MENKELKAVIVCGALNWKNRSIVRKEIDKLPKTCLIIEKGDTGAALCGLLEGINSGRAVYSVPFKHEGTFRLSTAQVKHYSMLDKLMEFYPQVKVLAFHDDFENSRSTKHLVGLAREKGIAVEIFHGGGNAGIDVGKVY